MKYRRKPVDRDVVDAIKRDNIYIVQNEAGEVVEHNVDDFERDYEPLKREPRSTGAPKKAAKKKASDKAGA